MSSDNNQIDPLAFVRAYPTSTTQQVCDVKGNLSEEQKQLLLNTKHYFVRSGVVDTHARVTFEVEVTQDMLSVYGAAHGGCLATLADVCTALSLAALSIATGHNFLGLSQTLNCVFHDAASRGTKLRIIGTTFATGRRLVASRCEMFDKQTGRLLMSAINTIVAIGTPQTRKHSSKL